MHTTQHNFACLITCLLLFLFLFPMFTQAQATKIGGFSHGWAHYDSSNETGLGSKTIAFDFTGVAAIDSVPEIGIHPRIFFGPNELPALRNRLAQTNSGQQLMAQIHAYTTLLHLSYNPGGYNHHAIYAKDAYSNRLIDNAGHWNAHHEYYQLIAEDPTVWDGIALKRKHITAAIMALEAFECLIHVGKTDVDTGLDYDKRATDLAKAMAFWAALIIGDPDVNSNNYNQFGGIHMALAYDLNYNNMTTAQQDLVRQGIAQITPTEPRHGAWLPAYANQSNWSALNSFEIITNLAIEGETGYQAALTERWVRAYHNFMTYGWYASGAAYEGLGKNYMFLTTAIALAKRGYSLLGHPHLRAYGTQFLPAITQPFGHGFTSYDVWGGSGHDEVMGGYKFSPSDVVGLKWIFPDDPQVDFVWRNYIEKWYKLNSTGYVYQQILPDDSYYNYLLVAAIFASDYADHQSWADQTEESIALDYLAGDRGLAVMKSSTSADALAVQFHCRQDMGGHTHGDRNDFTLSALGRIWVRKSYGGSSFQPTWFHSCLLIDEVGMGVGDPDGDKCRQPGTLLEWQVNDHYTKVTGDATYAYTWEWHWSPQSEENDHPWVGTNGWEKVTETWNDFQFIPQTDAHFNIPFYDYPHWHQAKQYERMVKRLFNPMEKIIRSVGVFKGEHPFVLIVDEVQKDQAVHQYTWLAQLARDLSVESSSVQLTNENYQADVILKEPESEGNRRLLVRVLNNEGYDGTTPPAYMDTLTYTDYFSGNSYTANPNYIRPRLKVESNSVTPNFKILLYPHYAGEELPITNWNLNKDTLSVRFGAEEKELVFQENEQGRTIFTLVEPTLIQAKVFLEGAFPIDTLPHLSLMTTDLATNQLLPKQQPFNQAPWNYEGIETVISMPLHATDWVLLEVRNVNQPTEIVEQKAALVRNDGQLMSVLGTVGVPFEQIKPNEAYRLIIRSRHHLAVASVKAITFPQKIAYDFTNSAHVLGGITQLKPCLSNSYALVAGDINQDGVINVSDFNQYVQDIHTPMLYLSSDLNLDGSITIDDFNIYQSNASLIGVSLIR